MKALIIDYNGPIVYARDFYIERSKRVAGLFGVQWREELLYAWKPHYIDVTSGQITLKVYYRRVARAFGVKDVLDGKIKEIDKQFVKLEQLADINIPYYLSELRRQFGPLLKMAVLSNYVTSWVLQALTNFDIRRYFDKVIVSDGISVRKPDILAYEKAVESLSSEPHRCLYLGDTVADLDAANKIRMSVVFIEGEEIDSKEYLKINNLRELADLLRE